MRAEDFFRLMLKEFRNCSDVEINAHFREFRKRFKKSPEILNSLSTDILSREGIVIDDAGIASLIEDLKQHKSESRESLLKAAAWFGTKSINLYIQEIQTQIRFANVCFGQYLVAKQKGDIDAIFLHIHHFIVHVACIDKLLDICAGSSMSIRARLFHQIVALDGVDLKRFRRMRNHLEHFEEHLEGWIYLHLGSPFLDMNLVDSHTTGLVEESCLRLLVCDKDEFVILGERFDLMECYRQIGILHKRTCELGDQRAG
jgi:hypothetical protein